MEDSEPYEQLVPVITDITRGNFDSTILTVYLPVMLVLILISALISGSEVSFFSFQSGEQHRLSSLKSLCGRIVKRLQNQPNLLIGTLFLSDILLKVSTVTVATLIFKYLFPLLEKPVAGILLLILITGLAQLFFVEVIPKSLASRRSLNFSLFAAPVVGFFSIFFRLFTNLLVGSTTIVSRKIAGLKQNFSMGDLSEALEISEASLKEEKNILKGIVKFGNIYVSEIMCSRLDVIAVDYSTSYDELLRVVNDSGFSRIPVYEETLDEIKGILYIKDLLPLIARQTEFSWQSMIRPSYYVPESKKINDLLKEFQKEHIHMAVVVDEYGGTSGIVTLEDILEEIVGEIADESDSEKDFFKKIDENTLLFEGKVLLNDFYKIVGVNDNVFDEVKGEADTLAGLILELRGEIPALNDKLSYRNFSFEISEVDKRRIKHILVKVNRKGD